MPDAPGNRWYLDQGGEQKLNWQSKFSCYIDDILSHHFIVHKFMKKRLVVMKKYCICIY